MAHTHQKTQELIPVLDHQAQFQPFHNETFWLSLYMGVKSLTTASLDFFLHNIQHLDYIINATDY